jgi:N-acetylneuraminic acid mutarotase
MMSRILALAALALCLPFDVPAMAADALQWKQLAPLPDRLGVAAPFAGVTDGRLLVAGGANFPDKMPWEGGRKVWHDRVWILDKPDGKWREAGKLPRALAYGVSVTTHDGVVCVGGSDSEKHYGNAFRLSWVEGKLVTKRLPALPQTLANAAGALVGDRLVIAGGAESPGEQSASNHCYAIDLSATEPIWTELPSIPGAARILSVAASLDDAFYIFGGAALTPDPTGKVKREYLRETWRYRDSDGWNRLADMPKAIVAAPSPAPAMDGEILILAGDDGSRVDFQPVSEHPGFPSTILAYDVAADSWREPGNVPAPRATAPVVQWGDAFVIPSGEMRPGVRSPEVWSFRVPQQ